MTEETRVKADYVMLVVRLEVMAMEAENAWRVASGLRPAYVESNFQYALNDLRERMTALGVELPALSQK